MSRKYAIKIGDLISFSDSDWKSLEETYNFLNANIAQDVTLYNMFTYL